MSNLSHHKREAKKQGLSWDNYIDILEDNGFMLCEGCEAPVEYDERDENGMCSDCEEDDDEED